MRPFIVAGLCFAAMLGRASAFSVSIRALCPTPTSARPLTSSQQWLLPRTPAMPSIFQPVSAHVARQRSRPLVMDAGFATSFLDGLNEAQKRAVTAPRGPTIVLAGPGSGKTRVLTNRIGFLLEQRVRPERVMAVTFTNKAANEMKKRIKALLGVHTDDNLRMTVGTFHGICVRILREFAPEAGLDNNFMIFDSKQQEKLVEEALAELNMDPKEFNGIRFTISRLKSEGLGPQQAFNSKTVAVGAEGTWRANLLESVQNVYEKYQELLTQNNAVDFDDLLLKTRDLLKGHAEVRTMLQDRYQHLLVDEWQDTNLVQYEIVKLLAIEPKSSSVFVVGDADQSIYGFRGADIRNVRQFIKDYDATEIVLELNYRSTISITSSAQTLIEYNEGRVKKGIKAFKSRGSPVALFEADDERHEAAYVASEIQRLVRSGAVKDGYRDIAVMYRTNRQSRAIEEKLVRAGIPYHLVGGKKFYERREVRDVLAYLRVIANPADNESFFRILNVPTRGIGKKTEEKLKELGASLGISGCEILGRMRKLETTRLLREEEQDGVLLANSEETGGGASGLTSQDRAIEALGGKLTAKQRRELLQFAEVMEVLREIASHSSPADLIDSLLRVVQYEDFLVRTYSKVSDDVSDRIENVMELKTAATLVDMDGMEGLIEFLNTVVLAGEEEEEDEQEEIKVDEDVMKKPKVKLLTLHASKGLEFAAVFMVGLEDDCLPHARCKVKGKSADPETNRRRLQQQRENYEEERRLAYVGMTRAKDRLYMCFKREKATYGSRTQALQPSRFLAEMISKRPEHFDLSKVSDEAREAIEGGEITETRVETGGAGAYSAGKAAQRSSRGGVAVTRRLSGSELAGAWKGPARGGRGRGGYRGRGGEGARGYAGGAGPGAGRGGGGQRGRGKGRELGDVWGAVSEWDGRGRGGMRGRGGVASGPVKQRGVTYKNGKVVATEDK